MRVRKGRKCIFFWSLSLDMTFVLDLWCRSNLLTLTYRVAIDLKSPQRRLLPKKQSSLARSQLAAVQSFTQTLLYMQHQGSRLQLEKIV
jgi:hypothetical protein